MPKGVEQPKGDPLIDLFFGVRGSRVSVDHGYALYGAISRVLDEIAARCLAEIAERRLARADWLHRSNEVGLHLLRGAAVAQMLSLCETVAKLASLRSSYLPAMAKVALVGCQDCETECRKHADKHAPCKECAEACAACADECKKMGA
jgi:Cys-rich four helix bundle protein (predicted Tat secretion target)